MKTLLKLKSWQLFAILFTPFIISAVVPFLLPSTYSFLGNIWIVFYLTWLYTLSISLYNNLEDKNKKKISLIIFQVLTLFTMISFVFIPISTTLHVPVSIKTIIYISSGVGLLFSIVYCAKILTLSEKHQSSLFLNLILLWFYPIGLWIIQPKMKAILKKGEMHSSPQNHKS